MLTIIYQTTVLISNIAFLSITGYVIFTFFKIKNKLYKMNAEELLQNFENENTEDKHANLELKTERLSAIIAGGGSKQYLGKDLSMSDIDTMTPEQINKLYCRYEARLGASMTKTLGNSFINLYVMGISKYVNVVDQPKLIQDLEEDPFINHALTNSCCELYYRFGMYLAPFTAMLTTVRHIDFSQSKREIDFSQPENITIENE
jgi:hypothetical protein